MERRPAEEQGGERARRAGSHLVHFYEDEAALARSVATYLAAGLVAGEGAFFIATRPHRAALEAALEGLGVDAGAARSAGRLVLADAQETLETFLVAGRPDAGRFDRHVVPLLEAAGRPAGLRVSGEMVAVLWQDGDVAAALALEELWNGMAERIPLALYCAYPSALVQGQHFGAALDTTCRLHDEVLGEGALAARSSRSRTFAADRGAVGASRRFVLECLSDWGRTALADDAGLVVSELASNAVRHARSAFTVTVVPAGGAVRILVDDASPERPAPRRSTWSDQCGRGLVIVDTLSAGWGTTRRGAGKRVWAEVA